jgi:hypothetical protein
MKVTRSDIMLLKTAVLRTMGTTEGDALVKFLSACQSERIQKEIKADIDYLNRIDSIESGK